VVTVDDVARLWIARGPASVGAGGGNTSSMERIIDVTQWSPRREWYDSELLARLQALSPSFSLSIFSFFLMAATTNLYG
jgi:hypothetical protein